ncbi:PTS system mannose/fructose/sorbose family transporter subunit IID [Archangium sp.]|uniref:PTS system mannose/fructose/sorbose family transporter subunit IID n=1 Tax=Archangium sp. TaxID=1872627 RepID=UPI00286C535B|nr:PTS system mannose/fructose/sorbose family transporter subunit IID [Archangium sp.]
MSETSPSLGRGVLLRVFLRSLFLQASWNPQGMQNLGLAYALYPALERLYPERQALEAAVRRHLVFFNTHPYVAAAIVGGVLYHEQRIARGEEPPDKVVAFKAALMGPLAALGDGFFWLSLKPATGAVCAALVPVLAAWAAVLFLFLYNLVHLTLRARLYLLGLTLGDRLVEAVARANLPSRGAKLRAVAAACAGGLAAWLAVSFGTNAGGRFAPLLSAGCLALGVVSYLLVARRVPNYVVLYLAAGLACAAGAFL